MNIAQSLDNLKLEQDAIVLYDALASIERDPRRAAAFRHIADNERRHADIWAMRLRDLGAVVPPASTLSSGSRSRVNTEPANDGPRFCIAVPFQTLSDIAGWLAGEYAGDRPTGPPSPPIAPHRARRSRRSVG